MNLIELMEQNMTYIVLGIAALSIIILVMIIIVMIKQHKLNTKHRKFTQGASARELETIILERFTEIDKLKLDNTILHSEVGKMNENLLTAVQKVGIVKYDAFMEMGGKLSFVLALLNKNNDGLILNSVHSSREGCYMYLKEIIKGESFIELSKEEKSALDHAINYNNFME
ncbi:MAG: DUF4446 family protein [Herbinix sp.]|nr:DUF4446 family protein [Herbinix sp.]